MEESTSGSESKTKRRVLCEVYSRVVGYLRPIDGWNKAKQQEFLDRVTFDLNLVDFGGETEDGRELE
ncbi:MAG: hypothetical protein AMJ88_13640 [Anaerolineae bacterium SM23_ 63]|nr:MAG: hypothetical protein AMJ88_13640 [Anaerolineae bacterium SM23_ 63]